MGKGYTNFMSKKAFHPGSHANQKRIRKAEEEAEAKRKHDEEKLIQYQKEQELFNQKSLVSKQSKDKLSLNFMYEPPAGVEKPDGKQGDKVEWKGSGSASKLASTSNLNKESTSNREPTICLEWKRDRPVKKSTQDSQSEKEKKPEVKQEKVVKKEPKTEPQIDLKWKRDLPDKKPKSESKVPDLKRIKKE